MRSPVEERGSSCRNTSRSWKVGTSFSMPITVMSVSGSVRHMRPLPSDSTTARVPVSATPKLAPEIATEVERNFSRRWRRAASARSRGSEVRVSSVSAISRTKISRICSRFLWMAGTRMWDGLSWPSCTMSSARSVSTAATPSALSASSSSISWVAMDFTLMTSSTPLAFTSSVMIRLASEASRAQWTTPPRAVTLASSCSSRAGRSAMTCCFSADPARRSSCQSGSSSTTLARLPRMVWVAWRMLARICALPSCSCADCRNGWSRAIAPWPCTGRTVGIPRAVRVIGRPPRRRRRQGGDAPRGC